jgi:hypothetical protein
MSDAGRGDHATEASTTDASGADVSGGGGDAATREASTSEGAVVIGAESTVVLEHALHASTKKTACFTIADNTTPEDNGIETLTRVMPDDDDDLKVPQFATARPPPGEEDVYSANTVAGTASDEMLAIIRGESQRVIPSAPGVPKNLEIDPKSDPKIEVKPDAKEDGKAEATAKTDAALTKPPPPNKPVPIKPPTPAAGAPPPLATAAGSKPAYTATPLEVPVTSLTPTSEPPRSVEIAPDLEPAPISGSRATPVVESVPPAMAAAESDETGFVKSTMHPAVGIVLFFIAVFAVLAALVR